MKTPEALDLQILLWCPFSPIYIFGHREKQNKTEFCLELDSLETNCRDDKLGIKNHLEILLSAVSHSVRLGGPAVLHLKLPGDC